ncbi:MAG: hypothetical protein ACYS8Z_02080 [Planctomycetota bacterium]|jgi:hypothetical protein
METEVKDNKDLLHSGKVIKTVEQLYFRISDRFPDSGLSKVCAELLRIARRTDKQISWIERPRWGYRVLAGIFLLAVAIGLVYAVREVEISTEGFGLADLVQLGESVINELVLIGAAIVFLVSIETRLKRKRVVKSVNRLRSIAHLIDAHQLTKDPNVAAGDAGNTKHSPKRVLTPYELNRYLDYCSEMLSLVGKIGFLYVQKFDDPVAVKSVNDLESLATSLSRKVWQKIMLCRSSKSL